MPRFIFSILFLFLNYYHNLSNADNIEYCNLPKGDIGICILITSCPSLDKFLREQPKTDQNINYLKQFHCGFQGKITKACCSLEDYNEVDRYNLIDAKNQNPSRTNEIGRSLLPSRKDCGIDRNVDRIIGGQKTDLQEFTWMALLEYETGKGRQFLCGGSLINERYVLTAAHCLTDLIPGENKKLVNVRLGEYDISTDSDCLQQTEGLEYCSDTPVDVKIEQLIPHELYNPKAFAYDIALLRLAQKITFTSFISPICLPLDNSTDLISIGTNLTVAGWGITEKGNRSTEKLKADIPLLSNLNCSFAYRRSPRVQISEYELCAGGVPGISTCGGDSGGPVMFLDRTDTTENYFAIGVVSFGTRSCDKIPGVYSRVSKYMDWILNHLEE